MSLIQQTQRGETRETRERPSDASSGVAEIQTLSSSSLALSLAAFVPQAIDLEQLDAIVQDARTSD